MGRRSHRKLAVNLLPILETHTPIEPMPPSSIPKKQYFPKVREAREALLEFALELVELKKKVIKGALDAQDFETADKAINYLMDHLSHEGVTIIDPSIDKVKSGEGPKGPTIQIGIKLGGGVEARGLPPATTEIIDVTDNPDKS